MPRQEGFEIPTLIQERRKRRRVYREVYQVYPEKRQLNSCVGCSLGCLFPGGLTAIAFLVTSEPVKKTLQSIEEAIMDFARSKPGF